MTKEDFPDEKDLICQHQKQCLLLKTGGLADVAGSLAEML